MMGAVSLHPPPGFVVPSFVVRELAAIRHDSLSGHVALAGMFAACTTNGPKSFVGVTHVPLCWSFQDEVQ